MSYKVKITIADSGGHVEEKTAKNLKEVIRIIGNHLSPVTGDTVEIEKKETKGLWKGDWVTFWLW